MTSYFVGDEPAQPLVVVPARDGDDVALELYDRATAQLTDATGVAVSCAADLLADDVDGGPGVAVTLPVLTVAGLQLLTVVLTTTAGRSDSFDTPPIVVQERDGWHTLSTARLEWPGANSLEDPQLFTLLQVSRIECARYAPKLEPGQRPPINYRQAQLTHARNRLASARVDPATGDSGTDGFSIGTFPLDWVVRQQLRPQHRLGVAR